MDKGFLRAQTAEEEEPTAVCRFCHGMEWVHPRDGKGRPIYTQTVRCRCMREQDEAERQRRFLKYCELPRDTEDKTLENFRMDRYLALQEAYQSAWEVVNGQLTFLTYAAGVDRGKTHLLIGICRKFLEAGKTAKYAYVPALLEELREGFKQEGENSFELRFGFYKNVHLLGLDDLGAESRTAWAIEKLEDIINHRYNNGLPTVITTNCSITELTDRIRSRLQRAKNSKVVIITTPEYRLVKNAKTKTQTKGKGTAAHAGPAVPQPSTSLGN
jgi:DNA replication protein DnaC